MKTRISAALNGIELAAIDPSVILQGVDELALNMNTPAVNRFNGIGQTVNAVERRYRDFDVRFSLAVPAADPARRQRVLSAVMAWAGAGGALSLSYRPGQTIPVVCIGFPAVQDVAKFAAEYKLTFRAAELPFFEDMTPRTASGSGASKTLTLNLTGTADSVLELSAKNAGSGTVNAVTIECGADTIEFETLGLESGETLVMDYRKNHLQRIRIKNASGTYRSALRRRTADSADDIRLHPGANTVTLTAGRSLQWTMTAYGRWL